MKQRFISILRFVLKKLSQLTIWKFHPGIVGVTGSVGKTSAKLAIASVLSIQQRVRVSGGNLNNDFSKCGGQEDSQTMKNHAVISHFTYGLSGGNGNGSDGIKVEIIKSKSIPRSRTQNNR